MATDPRVDARLLLFDHAEDRKYVGSSPSHSAAERARKDCERLSAQVFGEVHAVESVSQGSGDLAELGEAVVGEGTRSVNPRLGPGPSAPPLSPYEGPSPSPPPAEGTEA